MSAVLATSVPPGPFRGLLPYDESTAEQFLGRAEETQLVLQRLLEKESRTVTVTGESGVGKTSLVRAGVLPALARRGIVGLYIDDPTDLDVEILRAASRAGFGPLAAGESTPQYLARILEDSRAGLVLVLDHLERVFGEGGPEPQALSAVSTLIAAAVGAAPTRVRLLLVVSDLALAQLGRVAFPARFEPSSPVLLARLDQVRLTEILEATTTHSGTAFEPGFAAAFAGELCRARGGCLPLELQLCARALIDRGLTSIRKLESTGGLDALRNLNFAAATRGPAAVACRRVLQDVAERGRVTAAAIAARTHLPLGDTQAALRQLLASGLLVRRTEDSQGSVELVHRGLAPFVAAFVIEDRARVEKTRRQLHSRMLADTRGRLTVRELISVRRTLGPALSAREKDLFNRSLRRVVIQAAIGMGLCLAVVAMFLMDARQAYVLAFDPPRAGAVARVVVRVGRPPRGLSRLLPGSASAGSLLADTGFSAAGLAAPMVARIADGQAAGSLDPAAVVPSWLRDVVNGLRPVPRGVAKALIGDPDGVTSLKQAFSDPLARREALDSLAVIGRGRAGEDEILAAALADAAPEIRRRGVEVASEIDRHLGKGSHVTTLRIALGDRSLDVKHAVLREIPTLPLEEATEILAMALGDRDAGFRRAVEETTMAFAAEHPQNAVAAAQRVLESADGNARRSGMLLLERIAMQAPEACARVLESVVANVRAPEEARVAALLLLRRAGRPAPSLAPLLKQAAMQTTSPRLRAAALPLYARLIDASEAEEIARGEMKGPPVARVTGAAVWGAVAASHPELALKPLRSLLYDPSPEVRAEAARSFAFLKRDGISLSEKALRDPSIEVERAAVDSALALAPLNPGEVGNILAKAIKLVRPAMRRNIVDALGRLGLTRPGAALAPLARALKDNDVGTRVAVANAFCRLARQNAMATSPYLRMAARDDSRDVRAAAASCIEALASGDPKGGARMAMELVTADEPAVRAAATESLGRLATRTPELALGTLLKLVEDADGTVRAAAVRGLAQFGESGAGGPGFAETKRGAEAERALITSFGLSDVGGRQLVVVAAAKNRLAAVLRQATTDADDSVRLKAVRAAGALVPPALDVVRGAVDDRSPIVRAEATRILAVSSGAGAREVLPIFEAALRGGDHAAREAAIAGLGELPDAGEAAAKLLAEALSQRSESTRAAAARALGRLAEKNPGAAIPVLERALHDPAYDVANAAMPGLALAWSRQLTADALADIMVASETDSARRFVALEALLWRAQAGDNATPAQVRQRRDATMALDRIAGSGPPLARFAAQLGKAFAATPAAKLHPFLERLLGG
jgi:HEAT repeat protein